jgi:hypothetical protein
MMIRFDVAGRQTASSADSSLPNEFKLWQNQLTGIFGAMPALVPGAGKVRYGVPFEVAQTMAECAVREKQERLDPLPDGVRKVTIQKMVDDIKKTAVKVRLMLANVILIEKPHQRGDVQARDQSKQDATATLCTRNQGNAMKMVYICHF